MLIAIGVLPGPRPAARGAAFGFPVLLPGLAAESHQSSGVQYWKGSAIQGKGLVFEDKNAPGYQVYSVTRTGPGIVELHMFDSDLILVLDGSAMFVTGGSVLDKRALSAGEFAGSAINDGEPRRIARGDIIRIPSGTPHWFQSTDGAIRYFAVKFHETSPPGTDSPGVMYAKGTEAFARGGVQYENKTAPPYLVYASHRDKPGSVELHTLVTDLVFVVEGSATFVTGGSILERHALGPNQVGGSSISNGEAHQLGMGDIIRIPNGTPHWFQSVSGTIRYFAVTIRGDVPRDAG
jgi:mannose-6-phosphate isomerase-like protein (cupin superfamily)